jgi:hypothetical protein
MKTEDGSFAVHVTTSLSTDFFDKNMNFVISGAGFTKLKWKVKRVAI